VSVQARTPRRGQQSLRLIQREALRRPPATSLRRLYQGRDVASDEVVGLGVPDSPLQRVPGDLEGSGGVTRGELTERRSDVAGAQDAQRPGADGVEHRA